MASVYNAKYVSLHVRQTNRAAISLYRDSLGFKVVDVEKGYCPFFFSFSCVLRSCRQTDCLLGGWFGKLDADGENAFSMKLFF